VSATAKKLVQSHHSFQQAPLPFASTDIENELDNTQELAGSHESLSLVSPSETNLRQDSEPTLSTEHDALASVSNPQNVDSEFVTPLQHQGCNFEELRSDLSQTLKLAANALETHSVFLLLPSNVFERIVQGSESDLFRNGKQESEYGHEGLFPLASQTLSPTALPKKQKVITAGPALWVAKTGKPLHISPFEMDATGLGIYGTHIPLKSFAAVPFGNNGKALHQNPQNSVKYGVLAVDSMKAYKFTPLQMKLLQQIGTQVERLIALHFERDALLRRSDPESSQPHSSEPHSSGHTLPSSEKVAREFSHSALMELTSNQFEDTLRTLLSDQKERTLSVTSIRFSLDMWRPSQEVASDSPNNPTQPKEDQAKDDTSSGGSLLSRRISAEHLLAISVHLQHAWHEASVAFFKSLQSEKLEGETTGEHQSAASLIFTQEIVLVCDHLRSAMLTKKMRALFLFFLRKRLQYVTTDPREEAFEVLVNEIIKSSSDTLTNLNNGSGCLRDWLADALSKSTGFSSNTSGGSSLPKRPPSALYRWLRGEGRGNATRRHQKPFNSQTSEQQTGTQGFARSTLHIEANSAGRKGMLETLRGRSIKQVKNFNHQSS